MKDYSIVGQRMPRTDSVVKVMGTAKYTADIALPGMLFGKLILIRLHVLSKEPTGAR